MASKFFRFAVKFEFNAQKRYKFYMKLTQLLENGVSLDRSLQQIQSLSNTSSGSALPKAYELWYKNIINGQNFGQIMAPYVPTSETILLEAGSQSGKLVDALRYTATSIEQQSKVKKAIVGAAAYPALLLAMLIAAMLMASYNVIPTFAEIIPVEEWQGISALVAASTSFIRDYSLYIMVGLIAFFTLIGYSLPRWTSKSRILFESIPPWSIYRIWQGSSFLLAISSMMSSGVKIDDISLNKIAKQSDPYLRQRINGIKKHIISGHNLGDALFKAGYNFPDSEIISDLQIYAQLRGFEQNLIWITRSWVDSLVEKVNATMKIVNTIILMLIALVIGCLITAFYDIFQQIQSR